MDAEPGPAGRAARVHALAWPLSRLGEGLDVLARQSGLVPRTVTPATVPDRLEASQVGEWVVSVADWMGLEAERVECPYPELQALLNAAGPAVVKCRGGSPGPLYLLVQGSRSGKVRLIGTDLAVHQLPVPAVVSYLAGDLEGPVAPGVDQLLDRAGLSGRRRVRTRSLLMNERLGQVRIRGCWLLRHQPGERFGAQARPARLVPHALAYAGAHLAERLLWVASWWLIGRGALAGHLDWGWLTAWALVILTLIPFRLAATWYQGLLAVSVGSLLKVRLLQGALRLHPDELRHQGAGHHLGRVIESEAVESLALSGGLLGVAGLIELAIAAAVLAAGAGGALHVLLLLAWLGLTALVVSRYVRSRRSWTEARLAISHDVIEKMVGHRTRLAQQAPEAWHEGEDPALARYLELSSRMDRVAAWADALPRGWLVMGLAGIAPAFVSGQGSLAGLAVAIGGVLLAREALLQINGAVAFLGTAGIAWRQVAPLFHAAARDEPSGEPGLVLTTAAPPTVGQDGASRQLILDVAEVSFRYGERSEPVLRGLSLQVRRGERVLLESRSGGGKSTLVSLVSGLRTPDAGLVLLHGLDRRSWGRQGWARRVASAPQFHENHVIAETMAFNLLMGRRWPPYFKDVEEAEDLCRELGLGELLKRMPAGLWQRVGDMGWQLSHGEQSRLFLARALLQGTDLVVLDESFAALDPDTLRLTLDTATRRAPALVVVAHP